MAQTSEPTNRRRSARIRRRLELLSTDEIHDQPRKRRRLNNADANNVEIVHETNTTSDNVPNSDNQEGTDMEDEEDSDLQRDDETQSESDEDSDMDSDEISEPEEDDEDSDVEIIENEEKKQSSSVKTYKKRKATCCICYKSKVEVVNISNQCSHQSLYCLKCITKDVESSINQKGDSRFICRATGCSIEFEPHIIYPLLNKRNLEILDKLLLHKALRSNQEFRWCKSKTGCGNGQCVENWEDLRGYYCCQSCGEQHCFQHEMVWHSGFNCDEYDKYVKENADIATDAVLGAFTKKCPKCKVQIAKLEGCDVMTCCQYGTHGCSSNIKKYKTCDHGGRAFCGTTFCWRCLGVIRVSKRGGYRRSCKRNCPYASLN